MRSWMPKGISIGPGRCPSEQLLAAYADRQIVESERPVIEKHLAACDRCLQQIGFLARADLPASDVPSDLLQMALRRTATGNRPVRTFVKPLIPAFLAAILVVAIFFSWEFLSQGPQSNLPAPQVVARQTPESPPGQASPPSRGLVRGSEEDTVSPLLAPLTHQHIAAADLEFRWKSQSQASFYELRLASDTGKVLWEGRGGPAATSLRPPSQIHLKSGDTYFAWLRVHLASGAVQQFDPVEFVAE